MLTDDGAVICINPEASEIAVWDYHQLRDRGMPDGWLPLAEFVTLVEEAHSGGDFFGTVPIASLIPTGESFKLSERSHA